MQRRLNDSYQKVYRNRHIKARGLSLTDPEYRLWDLFTAVYDWDKTHTQSFGTIETTDRELAEVLKWSASKVCRNRVSLIKKGLIEQTSIGVYKLLLEKLSAPLEQEVAQAKQEIAPTQQEVADLQQKQAYTADNSLVSYKDKYRLERSIKEYEGLARDFPLLSIDDMKWIDENVQN